MTAESTTTQGDLTILLLGETGVGKSTWINGFGNFLQYRTLDEAEDNETICLIPSSFTITNDNYEEQVVKTGCDSNEVTEAGKSATQYPQTYFYTHNEFTVRLIDTPGIGDVRGVEQDKKNFERILDHISNLNELHAICILLKPNNARLNLMFTFCIKELLTHLHKDACRNIIFCFTNTRGTFYRPGDTLPALRKLLSENENVSIKLDLSTIYCMDNEAIRFLYAVKENVPFSAEERKNFSASWDKSVEEVGRLLKHARLQKPHVIKNTLSLNNARQAILALRDPLAQVSRDIQMNVVVSQNRKTELEISEKSKEELRSTLYHLEMRVDDLPRPRIVCTWSKCVEVIRHGPITETHFKTHCHKECSCGNGILGWAGNNPSMNNIVGHSKLKKCVAFDKDGVCKTCKCSYKEHMKIAYETKLVKRPVPNQAIQRKIADKDKNINQIQAELDSLTERIKELEAEQSQITTISAKLAHFLKTYAITPFNDSMIAYIDLYLKNENNSIGTSQDSKMLEGLLQIKQDYQHQMEQLQVSTLTGPPITSEDVKTYQDKLFKLKHSGEKLREMMKKSENLARRRYTETSFKSKRAGTSILDDIVRELSIRGAKKGIKGPVLGPQPKALPRTTKPAIGIQPNISDQQKTASCVQDCKTDSPKPSVKHRV